MKGKTRPAKTKLGLIHAELKNWRQKITKDYRALVKRLLLICIFGDH